MFLKTSKIKPLALVLIASVGVLLMCMVCPAKAMAEVIAHSVDDNGEETLYYSIDEAIEAGYNQKTIIMDYDWYMQNRRIKEDKSITIDMNGHQFITHGGGETPIVIEDDASLTLQSSKTVEYSYWGYSSKDGQQFRTTLTSGGILTGSLILDAGSPAGSCGIYMSDGSSLTLDNVAIAGNLSDWYGGVIEAREDCNIYMKNGASIQNNRDHGIHVLGKDTHIYMDNSSINDNFTDQGSAVWSEEEGTRIYMKNNSCMKNNRGGAVYFDEDYSSVSSEDGTAEISGNYRPNPGAGVVFDGSDSFCSGVTFKNNESTGNGGAILDKGSNNYIENCTITNNWCGSGSEGGGVYVSPYRNITLKGKVIVKDNTRGKDGSRDNLFLASNWFFDAYIEGGVTQGSEVGIRTGTTGARMVGKNISTYFDGTYFMDLEDSYYITHGNDHSGDLWQRRK